MASPTRIQQKSRPTKRPQMHENGYVYSGVPRDDKKGYPATPIGVPIPVLVKGFVDGPVGTTYLGTWAVGAGSVDGEYSFIYPDLVINDLNIATTDQSAILLALLAGDIVSIETQTGSNIMTVDSVVDGGDFVTVTFSAEQPIGYIDTGQVTSIWATDNV